MKRSPSRPTPSPVRLGGVLSFMRQLWAVDHGLNTASKRMSRRIGVTGPQRLVIRLVGSAPGIGAGDLAETLHLHPSTLTGILDKLVRRGRLRRIPDPADKRRASFHLTSKGRAVDRLRTGTVEATVRRAMSSSSPAQVEATRGLLARLARDLEGA